MKTKRLIGFSIILVILIISIGIVSAEDTPQSGNSTHEKTFSDVSKIIDNAKENDEITLNGTYISQGSEIKIKKALTIKGENDATLDGNNTSRIISTNTTLVFENITFKNAFNIDDGGAIKSTGKLTFINCAFIDNKIIKPYESIECCGSGVYANNDVTMTNCTFTGNEGDSIIHAYNLEIRNSRFMDNPAKYAISDHTTIVDNCEFTNNIIAIRSCDKVTNSRFNKNKYAIQCSDIYGEIIIDNSTFTGHTEMGVFAMCDLTIKNSQFISNRVGVSAYPGSSEGYEIPSPGKLTVSNCLFKSNKRTAITTGNDLIVKKTTFEDNKGIEAGAIYSDYSYGGTKLKISDSIFKNNSAEYAGAIKAEGAKITVTNTKFQNNTYSSIIITSTSRFKEEYDITYIAELNVDSKKFTTNACLNDKLQSMDVVKVTVNKVKTRYASGAIMSIKLINKFTKKPVKYSYMNLKIYTGKKYKNSEINTNNKGIAKLYASYLDAGRHKIEITTGFGFCKIPKTTTSAEILKAKTTVKAPKITAKHKKSKYFKVTVKNQATKKVVKNTYVKIKIDKKTYKIKTNSKGIAQFNTKKLKIGKHKVVISSGNTNYIMSAKSTITIK